MNNNTELLINHIKANKHVCDMDIDQLIISTNETIQTKHHLKSNYEIANLTRLKSLAEELKHKIGNVLETYDYLQEQIALADRLAGTPLPTPENQSPTPTTDPMAGH